MRAIFSILPLLFALCASAAPSITLEWGPSPDDCIFSNAPASPECVNNYRLYWGPGSGNYTGFRDLGSVTNTVFTNLVAAAHYFFVVTAMSASGAESDPSNEIDFVAPPAKPKPPTEFRITQSLQAAASPAGPWSAIGTNVVLRTATNETEFYRVVLAIEKER